MALMLVAALCPAASVPSAGDQLACATTCSDPALCGSLRPQPDPHRFEVVAPLVGGVRDLWQYGQNGSEWQNWLLSNTETVTTIPVMNSVRTLPHPSPPRPPAPRRPHQAAAAGGVWFQLGREPGDALRRAQAQHPRR